MCARMGIAEPIAIRIRVTATSFPMRPLFECVARELRPLPERSGQRPLEDGYFALKVKLAVKGFPAATVIFWVCVPSVSCQAVNV